MSTTILTPNVFWYYQQKNQSPLVTPEFLARQRRVLMPAQYAREHENRWVEAADSFTNAAEVEAAMGTGWTEQASGRSGVLYEHFWDLGSVKDPTVGCVGHVEHGIIYVDALVTFQGSHESPVLLPLVKQSMTDLARRFSPKAIRIESWQGLSASQELKGQGLPVELFAPTAKAHAEEWPVLRSGCRVAHSFCSRTRAFARSSSASRMTLARRACASPTAVVCIKIMPSLCEASWQASRNPSASRCAC